MKKRENIPIGERGIGTLGPAVPVNGGMLIDSSDDDHCTFSLHVLKLLYCTHLGELHRALYIPGDTRSEPAPLSL